MIVCLMVEQSIHRGFKQCCQFTQKYNKALDDSNEKVQMANSIYELVKIIIF